ncbi:MAG: MmcQ/YjbR family DNA-binding protein [Clostridiales bacterium]|nr:MmcQ/YjbR family DNA-binding protein [Clostridiales bacterium]
MANILYNSDKLLKYGFEFIGGEYVYTTDIFDNQFVLTVAIDESGRLTTTLLEKDIKEVYTLHLVSGASGKFVNRVREEYNKVLNDIVERCSNNPTKNELVAKIQDYAEQKYGDIPEYLWEKFPDTSVLRRKDTQKWYAIFMTVNKRKLRLSSDEAVPIIDLRYDAKELPTKVDNITFFPGYHMNKKHWITLILDGDVNIEEIYDLIDKSYNLAKK